MIDTYPLLSKHIEFPSIRKGNVDTFQVNLGYLCNQQCLHCHVNASPKRKEIMPQRIIDKIARIITVSDNIKTMDLTGGAPEMNPGFQNLISATRPYLEKIIVRSNLTILQEPGYEGFIDFFTNNQVNIVASLPCYQEENVNAQRGKNVFEESIKSIRELNKSGYGIENTGLLLDLVYNPVDAYLPPDQKVLEAEYKKILIEKYDIRFNNLYTITNMPIKRFGSMLVSKGKFDDYMQLLKDSFNPDSLDSLMCKNIISIGWDGYLYDCDFNQMLEMKIMDNNEYLSINNFSKWLDKERDILITNHCFACTAGQGSSCGGALV